MQIYFRIFHAEFQIAVGSITAAVVAEINFVLA